MGAASPAAFRLCVPAPGCFALLLCLLAAPLASAQSFLIDRTEATTGSPRMVPFELGSPAAEDLTIEATSSDPSVLAVMEPGRVLSGETLGFVRVRGLGVGEAVLQLGEARIAIDVQPQAPGPLTRARTPRIVAPPAGAVVWGTIGVGVKWTDDLGEIDPSLIRLRLPDGTRLEPVEASAPGSDGWAAFDLYTESLPPGPLVLVAERPSLPGLPARESEPLRVVVADAAELDLMTGEAEDAFDPDRPLPGRLGGDTKPNLVDDAEASGGRALANHGTRPTLTTVLDPGDKGGWYQAFARVRGTFSTGAFPALVLGVDAEAQGRAAGNSMGARWQRVAVGPPVFLQRDGGEEAAGDTEDRPAWLGEHERLISFRFGNDHAIRRRGGKNKGASEDRNLFIDSWELARLDGAPGISLPAGVDGAAEAAPDRGDSPDRLHAGLDPLPPRTRVSGGFEVHGLAATPSDAKDATGPVNTLFVNGRPVAGQTSINPFFSVPAAALQPGENQLRMRSTLGTAEAWSQTLRVVAPASPASVREAADRAGWARFAVDSGRWSRPQAGEEGPSAEVRRTGTLRYAEFVFTSNASAELTLPENLSGRFAGTLEGRPGWFGGPPRFAVELVTPAGTDPLGEHDLRSRTASFGEVDLPPGPKVLRVSFVNDAYDAETKKDRNLWLRAIRFAPARSEDGVAPVAGLRWPTSGATLGGFACLVVDAADARGVTRAQPLLDGEPAGPHTDVDAGAGRFLVPLLLRGVAGEHRVSVRLWDAAGNKSTTASIPVRVSAARTPRLAEAVFVLNRLGFGPEPAALADALVEGPRAWALARLAETDTAGAEAALARAYITHPRDYSPSTVQRRGLSWLAMAPDPLRARRVAFLDNHLTTWIQKARPERQAVVFGDLVETVDAPFFELLLDSATSPAMLRYLDQEGSFMGRINENYAREILELHTVGVHGGYTQKDVTELASVLTGLTAASEMDNAPIGQRPRVAFAFVPSRHDPRGVRAFGLDFPAMPEGDAPAGFDRVRRLLEALSAHPATAAHLADKLADHYLGEARVSPEDAAAEDAAVREAMAAAFLGSQGRLPAVLTAMVEHPAFAHAMKRAVEEGPTAGARVARPLDAAVRLQRVSGEVDASAAARYLDGAGFGIFNRETPDGYPDEDDAYADSNSTLQRWRFASGAANAIVRTLPRELRKPGKNDLKTPGSLAGWRQRLVDTLAGTLTGGLLSDVSNDAALSVLEEAGNDVGAEEVRTVAALISQLPEGALR